jgi:PhoPQ-activated pathogenicity-related protein
VAVLLAFAAGAMHAAAEPQPVTPATALASYVAAPDSSFGWKLRARGHVDGAEYVELTLTSQYWRGESWRHQLFIVKPDNLDATARQALLVISGGRWRDTYDAPPTDASLPRSSSVYIELARAARAPLAILRQVPFQPIFDGLTEDDAIAHTFQRFLDTGDPSWPLLLPMVKSAVRAMDAVQSFAGQEWSLAIDRFVVTGASKRGWTTWLTGATDPRVSAIAPMVIDVLRLEAQLALARQTWGAPSEQIEPYTRRGIDTRLAGDAGQALLDIVDPWRYRAHLTQPKLVINATNDPYWPLDAASLYWDGLEGEKRLLYVPNQGHGIVAYDRLLGGLVALHRATSGGVALPALDWHFDEHPRTVALAVTSSERPATMSAWIATSRSRDFRDAHWRRMRVYRNGEAYRITVDRPRREYAALFAEAVYRTNRELPLYLSTGVRILEPVVRETGQPR